MLDAGMILIVTGTNMTESDRRIIKTVIQGDMDVYWVGDEYTTDIRANHQLPDSEFDYNKNIAYIIEQLRKSNTIFY